MGVIDFLMTVDFNSPETLMFACKLFTIPLTFVIVYFGYKFYKLTSLSTLQSFTIGFSFLIAADLFAMICIVTQFEDKNSILWIQSILWSYGFSFIAVTYYFKAKSEQQLYSLNRIFGFAIIPLITYIGIMSVLGLNEMSNFFSVEEYFILYNLFLLAIIAKYTLSKAILSKRKDLFYIPVAFVFLFAGNFASLLYSFDAVNEYLVSNIIFKNIGLFVVVLMILQTITPIQNIKLKNYFTGVKI